VVIGNGALSARGRRLLRRALGTPDPKELVARGLRLGRNVYIGRSTVFDGGFLWLISVGDDTTISARVEILAHDASTRRHLGYSIVAPVTIGSRVYIGVGAIILPGVTIGDGAIVGAGSVVRHDVPEGTLAVGVPAKVVGTVEEYIERHRKLMRERPVYDGWEWTLSGGITESRMRQMQEDLRSGHGYVP
jgi:maltose O-acetyltransferase